MERTAPTSQTRVWIRARSRRASQTRNVSVDGVAENRRHGGKDEPYPVGRNQRQQHDTRGRGSEMPCQDRKRQHRARCTSATAASFMNVTTFSRSIGSRAKGKWKAGL